MRKEEIMELAKTIILGAGGDLVAKQKAAKGIDHIRDNVSTSLDAHESNMKNLSDLVGMLSLQKIMDYSKEMALRDGEN